MDAKDWVVKINRLKSFDALNAALVPLRLDAFVGDERRAIEAAIDNRRDYLVKIAGTL